MENSDSGDETSTEIKPGPDMMYVAIGFFTIIIGIALVAFFGGFYVMDEWDSRDWVETEVLSIGQDYTADEGTQTFFYNYSVDGVEYNSTFSCDYRVHGASEQTQGGSGSVDPWETQCLHDSEYYLNLKSVAYNPDDPSEIDVYPGFTFRMLFEVYGPKLAPCVLVIVGLVVALRGLVGPSFGPWAYFAKKIDKVKTEMTDSLSNKSKE
jgi:hypothetical protein